MTDVEGHSLISTDVVASYAADAALEIDGVRRLVEGTRPRHHGVRITNTDGVLAVELHLGLDWGASAPSVGTAVQERVAEYLGRMTDLETATVDVVVDDVGPPPEGG
jgi:uncharacterized alkaline shock family protein YloU